MIDGQPRNARPMARLKQRDGMLLDSTIFGLADGRETLR